MKHWQAKPPIGRILLAFITILGFSWLSPSQLQAAQTEPTPEPEHVEVYIVQAGDTLFAIAEHYGVPIDLLAAVNNINDPALLNVGQRLIIPPPPVPQEPSFAHVVQPGDTLHALSLRYRRQPEDLAKTSYLLRPDLLTIGQTIHATGHTAAPSTLQGRARTVRPSETLAAIALEFNSSPWTLAIANRLNTPLVIWPNSQLWIPAGDHQFLDWPEPFSAIHIHPIPAVQGQTVSIQISLTHPVSLTGNFMDGPLDFYSDQAGEWVALVGINALAQPAAPWLEITAISDDGASSTFAQPLPVTAGDFYSEDIVVTEHIASQMTAEVVQGEVDTLDRLFALQSPIRQWAGFFSLPTAGDVTSIFGNRRTYNIPNGSTYHSGTDFGRSAGAPVYAPAAGVVVFSEPLIVRGNVIIVDHGWGVMTGYWHLSASYVNPGDTVSAGQHIADIGNTGLSTGPHLHWEMRIGGVPVDGLQWVRESFP